METNFQNGKRCRVNLLNFPKLKYLHMDRKDDRVERKTSSWHLSTLLHTVVLFIYENIDCNPIYFMPIFLFNNSSHLLFLFFSFWPWSPTLHKKCSSGIFSRLTAKASGRGTVGHLWSKKSQRIKFRNTIFTWTWNIFCKINPEQLKISVLLYNRAICKDW